MLRNTDYIQQLATYVKKNLAKGYTLDSLRVALQEQGYSRTAIEKAINITNQQLASQAPKMIEKPVIKVETEPPVEEKLIFWQKIKRLFS